MNSFSGFPSESTQLMHAIPHQQVVGRRACAKKKIGVAPSSSNKKESVQKSASNQASVNPPSEATLVDSVLAGDREAFAELVRPHAGKLYGVALAILKDEADAEEAVQDAMLKAISHLAGFRREAKFSTWITQITINEARMRLRKARRHLYESLDQGASDAEKEYKPRDFADWREIPSESFERRELRDALQSALDSLPAAAKEVVILRDVQNYSTAETTQILGISIVAVKSRLLRARMQIRDTLAPGIDGAWSLGETKWRRIRPW